MSSCWAEGGRCARRRLTAARSRAWWGWAAHGGRQLDDRFGKVWRRVPGTMLAAGGDAVRLVTTGEAAAAAAATRPGQGFIGVLRPHSRFKTGGRVQSGAIGVRCGGGQHNGVEARESSSSGGGEERSRPVEADSRFCSCGGVTGSGAGAKRRGATLREIGSEIYEPRRGELRRVISSAVGKASGPGEGGEAELRKFCSGFWAVCGRGSVSTTANQSCRVHYCARDSALCLHYCESTCGGYLGGSSVSTGGIN